MSDLAQPISWDPALRDRIDRIEARLDRADYWRGRWLRALRSYSITLIAVVVIASLILLFLPAWRLALPTLGWVAVGLSFFCTCVLATLAWLGQRAPPVQSHRSVLDEISQDQAAQ